MTDSTANESDLWDEWQASERAKQSEPRPVEVIQEEAEAMRKLGWQLFLCPVCGSEGAAAASQQAEPVFWYSPDKKIIVEAKEKCWWPAATIPLYAAPPAVAEPVAIPSFIRRPIEQAINDAHNPPPGSMVVGMPKALVATDKLAYLLRMFDQGLYAAPPAVQAKPVAWSGDPSTQDYSSTVAPPADDEAVRLLQDIRERLSKDYAPWRPYIARIDAYLAKVVQ